MELFEVGRIGRRPQSILFVWRGFWLALEQSSRSTRHQNDGPQLTGFGWQHITSGG